MDHHALIYKVLSGEATSQEKAEFERWILENEENREEFEDLKLLWEYTASPEDNLPADDAGFEKIRLRMKAHIGRKRHIRTALSGLLLVLVVAFSAFLLRKTWFAPFEHVEFNGLEMRDVIEVLERKYDIDIEVGNSAILNCRYTAVLLRVDEYEVLRSIEHSLGVKFIERSRDRYDLVGAGCASHDAVPADAGKW